MALRMLPYGDAEVLYMGCQQQYQWDEDHVSHRVPVLKYDFCCLAGGSQPVSLGFLQCSSLYLHGVMFPWGLICRT